MRIPDVASVADTIGCEIIVDGITPAASAVPATVGRATRPAAVPTIVVMTVLAAVGIVIAGTVDKIKYGSHICETVPVDSRSKISPFVNLKYIIYFSNPVNISIFFSFSSLSVLQFYFLHNKGARQNV